MDDLLPLWFLYFSCHTVGEQNITVVGAVGYDEQTVFVVTHSRVHERAFLYISFGFTVHSIKYLYSI